jgi:hypothetical protein
MLFEIWYNHPDLGKVVVAIIRGKSEAMKKLNELNNDRINKRGGILFFMTPHQIKE